MGLDASVIGIGPFSSDIIACLEYGSLYSDVEPGTTVVTNVFIAPTSDASHALAKAFGVGAMEVGRHHLNPKVADVELLRAEFGNEDVASFQLLLQRGFQFYYLPNG